MAQARGTFTVQLHPVEGEPAGLGRFELDKVFEGELSGTSRGVMLSAGDPASGSAGYVVIEVVEAQVDGRTGGFALQHCGTMRAGSPRDEDPDPRARAQGRRAAESWVSLSTKPTER